MIEQANLQIIGQAERVKFPSLDLVLHARIDTGARTSAIWASSTKEARGVLEVIFVGKSHEAYTGEVVKFHEYSQEVVTSSTGHTDVRYKVKIPVVVKGRKINANFTLADRSAQVYPVLVGRNILRGKFVVDVKGGATLRHAERELAAKKEDILKNSKNEGGSL